MTTTLAGGAGGLLSGVTVTAAEAGDVPAGFRARTQKVYGVPLAKPETLCRTVRAIGMMTGLVRVANESAGIGTQTPAGSVPLCCKYSYPAMLASPGSAQVSTTCPMPARALSPMGCAGPTATGVARTTAGKLVAPAGVRARTRNRYSMPFSKPVAR